MRASLVFRIIDSCPALGKSSARSEQRFVRSHFGLAIQRDRPVA